MSLFAEYKKERENTEVIETPIGFATFKYLSEESVYLADVYITPSARRSGAATHLADQIAEIAKARGCKHFLTTVDSKANGATESLRTVLAYGFRLAGTDGTMILFRKDL